jgi:hypothetical protein
MLRMCAQHGKYLCMKSVGVLDHFIFCDRIMAVPSKVWSCGIMKSWFGDWRRLWDFLLVSTYILWFPSFGIFLLLTPVVCVICFLTCSNFSFVIAQEVELRCS